MACVVAVAHLQVVAEMVVAAVAVLHLRVALAVVAVGEAAAATSKRKLQKFLSSGSLIRPVLPSIPAGETSLFRRDFYLAVLSSELKRNGARQVLSLRLHPRATRVDRAGPRVGRNRLKDARASQSGHHRFRQAEKGTGRGRSCHSACTPVQRGWTVPVPG